MKGQDASTSSAASTSTSSSAGAASTSPKRIIVVDADAGWVQQVQQCAQAKRAADPSQHDASPANVVAVGGYLLAIADLARQGSADVLLGRLDLLHESAGATAAAIKRLCPAIKLVAVVNHDQQGDALSALAQGFDDYLIVPCQPRSLSRSLAMPEWSADDQLHTAAEDGDAPRNPVAAQPRADDAVRSDSPRPDAPRPDAPRSAKSSTYARPQPTRPDLDLGDVDLVEQMLRDRQQIAPLAMRILRAQSGIKHVTFVEPDAMDHPEGEHRNAGSAAVVSHGGVVLGHLLADHPQMTPILESWAAWLAPWLALSRRMDQLWQLALRDELTGVWNRRYFDRFLKRILDRASDERFNVTVMVLDIDDFKQYNDRFGHAAGDEILRETARMLRSAMRDHDVVARIGGDEFAVVFWDAEAPRHPNSRHPADVQAATERFQRAVCECRFPKLADQAPGTLTVSGGIAGFPWDGRTAGDLLELADQMAMQSKTTGKNAFTLGPGARRMCPQWT